MAIKNIPENQEYNAYKALKRYEQLLQAEVNALDRSLALRQKDEAQYYKELGEYLESHVNNNSELYFKQLSRLEKYQSQQLEKQKKAAEEQKKAAEKAAEEQKKIIDSSLNEILKKYQAAYDELDKKRQNYRKKLLAVGGDLFTADITKDEDGSNVTTYTVNNINDQLKAMKEYHNAVKKLKEEGASESLLNELTSLGTKDSQQFAKYLSGMSESEFAKVNELYDEKQKLADELSADLYSSEAQSMSNSINSELESLKNSAEGFGKEAGKSYAEAFAAAFEERIEKFEGLFGDLNVPKKNTIAEKISESFDSASEIRKSILDISEEDLIEFLGGPAKVSEIIASIQNEMANSVPAAVYETPIYSSSPEITSEAFLTRRDLEEVLGNFSKPVQVVLDGTVIGETAIQYQRQKQRQTGT